MEQLLIHHGYLALVVLAVAEACCIPIPSELTVGFAGVLAGQHHLQLAAVIVLATLGELCGSVVAYTVGRHGGRHLIVRYGRFVLIGNRELARADRFVVERGKLGVVIGRMLPLARALVSVAAGVARMPRRSFAICSAIGTLIYVTAVSGAGYGLGKAWPRVAHLLSLGGYVVIAVVALCAAAFVAVRLRDLRVGGASAVALDEGPPLVAAMPDTERD